MSKSIWVSISYSTIHSKPPADYKANNGVDLFINGYAVTDKYYPAFGRGDPGENPSNDIFDYAEFSISGATFNRPSDIFAQNTYQSEWGTERYNIWHVVTVPDSFVIPAEYSSVSSNKLIDVVMPDVVNAITTYAIVHGVPLAEIAGQINSAGGLYGNIKSHMTAQFDLITSVQAGEITLQQLDIASTAASQKFLFELGNAAGIPSVLIEGAKLVGTAYNPSTGLSSSSTSPNVLYESSVIHAGVVTPKSPIDYLVGSASDDNIISLAGNDIILAGPGNDLVRGTQGGGIYIGGDGIDTIDYKQRSFSGVTVDLLERGGEAIASFDNGMRDRLSGFENVVGTQFDDTIFGNQKNNNLSGGAGNDVLFGGAGNDIVDGGGGADTIIYLGNRSNYIITSRFDGSLTVQDVRIGQPDGVDILKSVETLEFSAGQFSASQLASSFQNNGHLFGSVTYQASDAGGQVYALYVGILGRAPDTSGLEYWADQFSHGASPTTLTAGFLASAEGQARLGASDNTGFVQQLYQNTLNRAADADGLSYWTDQLAHNTSRVDVANSFVFSPEFTSTVQQSLSGGLFVPDAQAAQAARVYYTMLGRAPDASGLAYWTDHLEHGGTPTSVAQAFLGTPESQATYGKLSNSGYVDALYVNALGRHAESGGLSYWTSQLDHGTSRADLAASLSQSAESQNFHFTQIQQGWQVV